MPEFSRENFFLKHSSSANVILTLGAGDIWNAVNILAFKKKFSAYNRLNIANAAAASYISEYNRGDFPLTKVEELLESRGINTDSL